MEESQDEEHRQAKSVPHSSKSRLIAKSISKPPGLIDAAVDSSRVSSEWNVRAADTEESADIEESGEGVDKEEESLGGSTSVDERLEKVQEAYRHTKDFMLYDMQVMHILWISVYLGLWERRCLFVEPVSLFQDQSYEFQLLWRGVLWLGLLTISGCALGFTIGHLLVELGGISTLRQVGRLGVRLSLFFGLLYGWIKAWQCLAVYGSWMMAKVVIVVVHGLCLIFASGILFGAGARFALWIDRKRVRRGILTPEYTLKPKSNGKFLSGCFLFGALLVLLAATIALLGIDAIFYEWY
ncbi:hypothetical protein NEHOM01_1403 [Nematocida homosporus]|uniref:uncharacterized protein n=1 Tax=Nematocida homosporus TaxID=1912981 RepID=UPI00221F97B2|nr:uncharacterized protein NEHOM01_1403 [Nematocida homosporus]KAI5186339.1 hypothetical protein NEHOM01_1403 [Nematocida homosporus]